MVAGLAGLTRTFCKTCLATPVHAVLANAAAAEMRFKAAKLNAPKASSLLFSPKTLIRWISENTLFIGVERPQVSVILSLPLNSGAYFILKLSISILTECRLHFPLPGQN